MRKPTNGIANPTWEHIYDRDNEIERLEAENNRLKDRLNLIANYDNAEGEIEEVRKDAERYRWLRQIDRCIEWENLIRCKWGTITTTETLDAAIDAAMEGEK